MINTSPSTPEGFFLLIICGTPDGLSTITSEGEKQSYKLLSKNAFSKGVFPVL